MAAMLTLMVLAISCGPLPRPGILSADLGVLPVSDDITGLIFGSTDSSYTSSDLYVYNLANGHLDLLSGGESGDVMLRWHGGKLWIFNRAAGRVSFSALSPKVGVSSRNLERRTPNSGANDPTDVIWASEDVAVLAMQGAHKVSVANLKSGESLADRFDDVDTLNLSVPFRPGLFAQVGGDIAVFHQSLDTNWQAMGGGVVYLARSDSSGQFAWMDQDVTVSSIQGLRLNISNPVQKIECDGGGDLCLVAGSCFESMGPSCIGGVDGVHWGQRSVTSQFTWPSGSYAAGSVARGIKQGQVTACLKLSGQTNAQMVLYDLASQSQVASWDSGASWCGSYVVDRAGGRVFIAQKIGAVSFLIELDGNLVEKTKKTLGFDVTTMEAINE